MRIAIATSDYHVPGETFINRHIAHIFGGAALVIAGRRKGDAAHEVPVFSRRDAESKADQFAKLVMAPLNRMRFGTGRPPFGATKRGLRQALEAAGVEAILAEFGTQALAVYPVAREMGLPCFTYFRGTDASKALNQSNIPGAYRKMMPHLAGVFSVSQFLLDNLARHGVSHDNAHVIPSGVDVRRFQPSKKMPMSCLAVGRMVEKKAPLVTLQAFLEATRDNDAAHLDFVGDGPLLAPAQALVAAEGAQDKVTFHGAQPHDFVCEKLSATEFFLQHSITAADGNTEGLPTAIQEAMAAGCLTISTRHAGIPEAIDEGVTGWLVDEHDAQGFTALIAEAMQTGGRAEMAAKARRVAEDRFDNDTLLRKLEGLMQHAVSAR